MGVTGSDFHPTFASCHRPWLPLPNLPGHDNQGMVWDVPAFPPPGSSHGTRLPLTSRNATMSNQWLSFYIRPGSAAISVSRMSAMQNHDAPGRPSPLPTQLGLNPMLRWLLRPNGKREYYEPAMTYLRPDRAHGTEAAVEAWREPSIGRLGLQLEGIRRTHLLPGCQTSYTLNGALKASKDLSTVRRCTADRETARSEVVCMAGAGQ